MTDLASVWGQVKNLLENGFSVIPVRDKATNTRREKTPFRLWEEYQSRIIDEGELWQQMEYYNTSAIALVCGKVSGNLECIDVDTKYKAGFDATLFSDLKSIYPHLLDKVRVHKTPSGGYHIIYRVEEGVDIGGSVKLASRETTEEEVQAQVKRGSKRIIREVCFLETRGEGGYFLFPPSLGYAEVNSNPIPVLTKEERASLINLCKSYNEVIKIAPKPRPTKAQDNFYSVNPFEDFNNRCDPESLMQEFGWKPVRGGNNRFIYFTRPGKDNGISASFNLEKRIFYIFTSSTEFEGSRGYNPATILAELKFNGDKKEAFKYLINNGFGEYKKHIEERIVKRNALNKKPLPPNFSKEAKEDYEKLKEQYKEDHPFGLFWEFDKDAKAIISHEDFLIVSRELGFRNYNGGAVHINGKFVEKVEGSKYFDTIKEYIKEEEEEIYKAIANAFEKFVQKHGKFIIENRLDKFDEEEIVTDTIDTCYKFFNNTAVRITPDKVEFLSYSKIDGLIWADSVIKENYDFDAKPTTLYTDFIKNSTGRAENGDVQEHVKNIIGYLCHNFKSEAAGYIVVMQEMVLDPKDGGGAGKNLFGNILEPMISIATVPGSMVKFDDKFFAAWNGERVYFLADVPKKIDWLFLKEMSTGKGLVNKKYVGEYTVGAEDMAKLLINTNYSYEEVDGGLKRRIIPIEFTDYYTVNGGVDQVHGKMFPMDFSKGDWRGYYDAVFAYIQYHLSKGGKLTKPELSDAGWEKKFINQYNDQLFEYFSDNISFWVSAGEVEVGQFRGYYDSHADSLNNKYKVGGRTLLNALTDFCERKGIELEKSKSKRINGMMKRVHIFKSNGFINDNSFVDDDEYPF